MIHVVLADGSRRALDEAEVTLSWPPGPTEEIDRHEYALEDVRKLVMIDAEIVVGPGLIGGGMPVVGLALLDTSDLSIEVPMPLESALEIAKRLPQAVLAASGRAEAEAAEQEQQGSGSNVRVFRAIPPKPKPPGSGAA